MRRSFSALGALALGLPAALILTLTPGTVQRTVNAGENPAARPEFYTTQVKPIFDANCARCHEGTNHRGGLNLDTRASLLKGGHDGPAIVPGDPANSMLIKLIRHEGPKGDPMDMPPKRPKLSDADMATVTQWIQAGAVMPPASNP